MHPAAVGSQTAPTAPDVGARSGRHEAEERPENASDESVVVVHAAGWRAGPAIRALHRREHSLRSRLLSIEADALACLHLFAALNRGRPVPLPLFANARAGWWYVPPSTASGTASFKSADGHFGQWSVSLRRPNLAFFRSAAESRGVALVDATRAGKRVPDALSKTVPLWCAAMSLIAGLIHCPVGCSGDACEVCADLALSTPPGVPASERAQMVSLLPAAVDAWSPARSRVRSIAEDSHLDVPLRPLWTSPGRSLWPDGVPGADALGFVPVVCISASVPLTDSERRDRPGRSEGERVAGVEFPVRRVGYCFVQGAGDDEEAWSRGLSAGMFWERREEILEAEDEMGVEDIVKDVVEGAGGSDKTYTVTEEDGDSLRGAKIALLRADAGSVQAVAAKNALAYDAVIVLSARSPAIFSEAVSSAAPDKPPPATNVHYFPLENHRGKPDAKHALCRSLGPILSLLLKTSTVESGMVCILGCGRHGMDGATGVAVAWVALHADEENGELALRPALRERVTKEVVRTAMLRVLGERCDLALSRAALLQINRFFQSPCPSSRIELT